MDVAAISPPSTYRRPPDFMLLYGLSLVAAVCYAVFFSWLSIQRYDAFLMHALDMGNMDQAVWNTLHGNLFHFTNMRVPLAKEAWGTTTRLSFHVEPILLPLSLVYLIHAAPESLIIVQAVVVALGAPAACRLALRVTGSVALAIIAPLAYLLAPSLQSATLYEFHPVTLTTSLLLWAIVYLEERKFWRFVPFAVLAIACKEEIGLIVAALCLWYWWRGGPRHLALTGACLAGAWSIFAIGWVVPHFAHGPSAYWQRYIDATAGGGTSSSGAKAVLSLWFHHPDKLVHVLTIPPKWAMLHRYLVATGYLSLFALPLLAASLPSLAIILLSTDQHTYGGLAQDSAELVPIGVAASIYGVAWLSKRAAKRGLNANLVTAGLAVWLGVAALANQHFNGFSPLATGYSTPAITAHDRLGQRLLQLIPPGAPVSSMDQLNPHLGDRAKSYLFPDVGDAEYVALDVTTNVNPGTPVEQYAATVRLLQSRQWEILAADDGYLVLHRVSTRLRSVPRTPSSFYTFTLSADNASVRPIAKFGPDLELVGVGVIRREQVSLRVPDAILQTTWRVLRPLPAGTSLIELLVGTRGKVDNHFTDRLTTDWLPMAKWQPGQLVHVNSVQISFTDTDPGLTSLRLEVARDTGSGQFSPFEPRLLVVHRNSGYDIVDATLQVARIRVSF